MQTHSTMQEGTLGLSLRDTLTPGGESSEARLVQAAQRGNREAFDTLTRSYAGPLRGFLQRRVGADAAEDVLQETWLAGWLDLRKLHRKTRFKAWLYGIAAHKCLDYQRTQARSRTEELTENGPGLPEPEDVFAASDRARAVRAALAGLPDAQQEVLELYFYAELTLPEIAALLGRNLNTLKYQFYRAHAQAALALPEYAPARPVADRL